MPPVAEHSLTVGQPAVEMLGQNLAGTGRLAATVEQPVREIVLAGRDGLLDRGHAVPGDGHHELEAYQLQSTQLKAESLA